MRKPFTPEQDKRITESFADYEVTMKDLADRFGCTPSAIAHAVKRHLNILIRHSTTTERDVREQCAKSVEALPSQGWYRVGGGYHAPSYDDAWKVAARTIREIPCTVKSAKE